MWAISPRITFWLFGNCLSKWHNLDEILADANHLASNPNWPSAVPPTLHAFIELLAIVTVHWIKYREMCDHIPASTPKMAMTWASYLAHDDADAPFHADAQYRAFFERNREEVRGFQISFACFQFGTSTAIIVLIEIILIGELKHDCAKKNMKNFSSTTLSSFSWAITECATERWDCNLIFITNAFAAAAIPRLSLLYIRYTQVFFAKPEWHWKLSWNLRRL